MKQSVNIFWFRRDLRLDDNAGLYHALKSGLPVIPVFIFDKNILNKLEDKADRRVQFIYEALNEMQKKLMKLGSSMEIYYGFPEEVYKSLLEKYNVKKVITNHDYELYAAVRDDSINKILNKAGASLHTYKDQVIFEKKEVVKDDGNPYTVFTPYSRKWKATLNNFYLSSYPTEKYFSNFHKQPSVEIPSLSEMGFIETDKHFPAKSLNEEIVKKYSQQRDYPSVNGTSKMGVHLRFGTVSIRKLAQKAMQLNETYLNELIWRDFYHMILWNFPPIAKDKAFKPEYDFIQWRNNEKEFDAWCNGQTGYPIVDAGMRELNTTGYMHNRVRMIVASFLTKHLLIDWRWGEAYFAKKLLDFDFAANNGGWQWAAGSGCDAAPYFRIFNPYLQTQKFDQKLEYINKWVPELNELTYPQPIVDHEFARKRCLEVYGKALGKIKV
ncbi:MAG: deoxyribodipyrimidine photo-lyase [Sphingobacteriales bacterium]|nr:deoxyribodipyrimidine photo-lyase [Sphingobacteriales bacterium]MBI3718840.1 deoxyribodipyrimidine photo-lyase [Sphingobacteriales bacterium]